VIAGGALDVDTLPADQEQFQQLLDEYKTEDLPKLQNRLEARFKELRASAENGEKIDPDLLVERLTTIDAQTHAVRAEVQKRRSNAAKDAARLTAEAHRQALAELDASMFGDKKGDGSDDDDAKPDGDEPDGDTSEVATLATTFAKAFERALGGFLQVQPVTAAAVQGYDLNKHVRSIPLSQVRQHQPDPKVLPARSEAVLVASADIPGRVGNARIGGIMELTSLVGDRAKMLPLTRGKPNYVPVAKLIRDFRYKLNLDSTPDEIDEVLTAATDVGALVAAGGWCAPSEISYDFFNVVCEDGLLDIPSVGVLNRGGFRYPTSPTIAEIFADANVLWSWTEAQDQSAADNGDSKTCARVACPEFDEVRAACDGLCVTAGNLTDYAYPEMVANFLRLVMAARAHRTNQTVLAALESASTGVNMAGSGEGTTAAILNSIDLQAYDYRERFRMCEDAILEAVFPRWAIGAIRADLANRQGLALFSVNAGMIADWFNERNVRAQFVADWQSGFTGDPVGSPVAIATAWPTTVDYLLYAPGTFVRGQALQLDLGVVRDSTLNAKNDHTAAWMEDCYAIAEVGHESRIVTTDVCTAGVTGAAELVCPS
jgi:hypothetical protein